MHAIIRMSHNVTILYRLYISLFLKSSIHDIIIMPRGWFPVREDLRNCTVLA